MARVGAEVRVSVHGIAAGGDGVARLPDGRVVFVPRTAPGDEALVQLRQARQRWARADLVAVAVPGPDRVEPPCAHYTADMCGGCQLQHLTPGAQRSARSAIVGDALRRIGRQRVDDPEVEPAPAEWGYRHKVTLARGSDGRLGFHRLGRPGEIFDLDHCAIADPRLMQGWAALRAHRDALPAALDRIVLRVDAEGRVHAVVVHAGRGSWQEGRRLAEQLTRAEPAVVLWEDVGSGPMRVDGRPAEGALPTTFEQVAPGMGRRVRAWAVESLGGLEGLHAWDLYAGLGETAELLRAGGATVDSVEADAVAVVARPSWPGVTRHAARVEDSLAALPEAQVVVVNPPRTGLSAEAAALLLERPPARLAYVSCDPATLARDLARLAGYRVARLRAFDLFPQTAHVETVAVLERA